MKAFNAMEESDVVEECCGIGVEGAKVGKTERGRGSSAFKGERRRFSELVRLFTMTPRDGRWG
jgi:hypothetical protein